MRNYRYILLQILLILISATSLVAGIKVYDRIGSLPEFLEIYQVKGDSVYIDINSIPPEYRTRIRKNPDVYIKVDMEKISQSKKVTKTGAVIYEEKDYATDDANLYQMKGKKIFIDMDTVSPDEKKDKLIQSGKFLYIGKSELKDSQELQVEVEERVTSILKRLVGEADLDLDKYGNVAVAKIMKRYDGELEKLKESMLSYFDKEIKKVSKMGNLELVNKLAQERINFLEKKLDIDAISNHLYLKKNWDLHEKKVNSEGLRVGKQLDSEIKSVVRSGAIAIANKIKRIRDQLPVVAIKKTVQLGIKSSTRGPRRGRRGPCTIYANCDDVFEIYHEGRLLLAGSKNKIFQKSTSLGIGDTLLVRAVNTGGKKGFSCIISFGEKGNIISNTNAWKQYTPKNDKFWFSTKGISKIRNSHFGNNQEWKNSLLAGSKHSCEAIWGDSSISYLILTISSKSFL